MDKKTMIFGILAVVLLVFGGVYTAKYNEAADAVASVNFIASMTGVPGTKNPVLGDTIREVNEAKSAFLAFAAIGYIGAGLFGFLGYRSWSTNNKPKKTA